MQDPYITERLYQINSQLHQLRQQEKRKDIAELIAMVVMAPCIILFIRWYVGLFV